MGKRNIIKIDEAKCNGLGACLGHCLQGAITIEEREAEDVAVGIRGELSK